MSRLRQFFLVSPTANSIYRGLIHPCLEYASHVWGGSTHKALLNRVEWKVFRLINSSPLTDCLQPFSHRRNVASLALFYRYFCANCSSDLANCMPALLPLPRCTRLASFSHPPYSVHLSNARVNQYSQSFIPLSGKLWNSPCFCISICLWLELFQEGGIKTLIPFFWLLISNFPRDRHFSGHFFVLFYFCCPRPPPST